MTGLISYLELSNKNICDATYDSNAVKHIPGITEVILKIINDIFNN